MAVDLVAPVLLTRLVLPGMLERKQGRVVNVSSFGARIGMPCMECYLASNARLILFTESLRAEYEGTGVSASCILLVVVKGEGMLADFMNQTDVGLPKISGSCTPEEVANETIRAIKKDLPEVIVNSVKPGIAAAPLVFYPSLRTWVMRTVGA